MIVIGHVDSVDFHGSLAGGVEPLEDVEAGGFTATRGTHQGHYLASGDLEAYVLCVYVCVCVCRCVCMCVCRCV